MVRHERVGATIFLLILLILVTPRIPTITGNATLMGVSVNDSTLMLLVIIVFALIALAFYRRKPDLSTSNARFKQFYKPHSDLTRLSQFAQERTQSGDSSRKVQAQLIKAGWDKETIQSAMTSASKEKLIREAKVKQLAQKANKKKALKLIKKEAIKKRRTR